jgi:hypothetical protein
VAACRAVFSRVVGEAIYIAPPKDPREYYFEHNLDAQYDVPVYRRLKTSGSNHVSVGYYSIDGCADAAN